jgi:hypothetical protein
MATPDDQNTEISVDYYILGSGEVGRVRFDSRTGEYVDGNVMSKSGEWCKYPISLIIRDGEMIATEEAEQHITKLGGDMHS